MRESQPAWMRCVILATKICHWTLACVFVFVCVCVCMLVSVSVCVCVCVHARVAAWRHKGQQWACHLHNSVGRRPQTTPCMPADRRLPRPKTFHCVACWFVTQHTYEKHLGFFVFFLPGGFCVCSSSCPFRLLILQDEGKLLEKIVPHC